MLEGLDLISDVLDENGYVQLKLKKKDGNNNNERNAGPIDIDTCSPHISSSSSHPQHDIIIITIVIISTLSSSP